ncbi:MAG: histidine phosphatase family protein [Nocardioides sp.]
MADRTLVLVRHSKSDWSGSHADRDRPLARRGRRQAAEAGRWLAEHVPRFDLAVVSPAARAVQTWDLVAAALRSAPPVRVEEAAYTFDGHVLHSLVRDLEGIVALVGHNPAVEELLELLTGEVRRMPTSCLAVVDLDHGRLTHHGRPPA